MLTVAHKKARVSWANRHLNDNWDTILFSGETAFQLFRNTITQWYKGERRIPKDHTKIFAWGGLVYTKKLLYFVLEIS